MKMSEEEDLADLIYNTSKTAKARAAAAAAAKEKKKRKILELGSDDKTDAVFLSCTSLRLSEQVEEINRRAVELAREAGGVESDPSAVDQLVSAPS